MEKLLLNTIDTKLLKEEFAKIGVPENKTEAIINGAIKEQKDRLDRQFIIETTLKDIDIEVKEDAETELTEEDFYNLIDMLELVDGAEFKVMVIGTSKGEPYNIPLGTVNQVGLDFVLEGINLKKRYYTYNGDIFVQGTETLVITPLFDMNDLDFETETTEDKRGRE